jgi:hypothetical protein
MKGGEISGNTATGGNGGGVYVAGPGGGGGLGGSFTMQGGTIKNNNANSNGGAVYVDNGGTFFMQGGTVSGNTATGGNGGGAYVATGGTFVKATGAMIYGGGVANANTAAVSGHAVYVQGGRYRDDTVVDFLDSGRSITAGGWDYPVIPHTYYETDGTDGHLAAAGQVDWYVFTAPGGGAPLSVSVESGPVKASAYRAYGAYGAPISLNAAPPAFAAGETVYVKVEGNAPDVTGTYKIRQGPLLLISDSHPVGSDKANPGNITAAGQVDWYFFTAENDGTYSVMWEDSIEQAAPYYTGNVKVSAYKYDATPIPGLVGEDNGYNGAAGKSLGYLDAGDTIYVKAVAQSANGTYGIRYYAP